MNDEANPMALYCSVLNIDLPYHLGWLWRGANERTDSI